MNTDENTTTPEDNNLPGQPPAEQQGGTDAPPAATAAPEATPTENASESAAPRESAADADDADEAGPSKPIGSPHAKRWEEDEEPGDNIGNRAPSAPRDDIGNRRSGPQRPGGGGGGGGGRPAQQGGGSQKPRGERGPSPLQRQGSSSAEASAPGAPGAADAPGSADASGSADAPGAADAPGSADASSSTGAPGAPGAPGEGASPAKKRRRRRRKGGAAQPQAGGAEGAQAAETAPGSPSAEGADEHEENDELEAAEGTTGDGAEENADEGGEQQAGPRPPGEKRRPRRGPPGGQAAAAARERPAFSVGEDVFGKVSRVTPDAIWIDIAGKATGLFDRRELSLEEPPVEGDQFIATVASTGVRGGMLMLSRSEAKLDEARAKLEAASKSGEPVEGFVTGAVKGGLEVDLAGLRAFAPASHVDLRHGSDLSYLVGQRLDFIVTQYAKKGRDIVVSRRRMLEEESQRARVEAMKQIEPGTVHKAIVRKVVAWGAFVTLTDAGGVEGLVHMTEASHDRGARLNEIFKQGAEIEVKVLRVDEKGKLWLSRKAATADPWDAVKEKYSVGSRHTGKVARLQPFGAFIELESGIDGLIHTADLSLKPIQHPNEVVKVGDEIQVVVASCDSNAHKIGLHPAPPAGEENEPRQKVMQGKTVKATVSQVIEGGLVVRILGVTGRTARAFIPAGHTGTQRGTDLRKEFPVDTRIEAKVLEVDPRRGEAKLSIRALKEDTEKQAYQQYRAGVAREAKFGTFADLMKKS